MAVPNSRATLIDYCKRRLGEPVIEINVDEDQLEDRVDESLQFYQEYHSDATVRTYLKHEVTATDVSNKYIPISSDILFVSKLLPLTSSFNTSRNFFDIKYQMMLNDVADLMNFAGDLAYYEQMQQYLSVLDMKLNGHPQTQFARRQDRLYIFGDFADKDIKEGGPPFGVKEDEVKKLFSKQWKITEDCFPVQSIQTRKGREKLIVFEKL